MDPEPATPDPTGESAQLRELLLRAELSRRETLEALQDFNSQLETLLATHRSQRAWKVMLWLRKAYTLLFRKSKTAFLRFLAATPFTGGGPLETYEPEFPALNSYLPRDFHDPFTATPLSTEILDQARLRRRAGAVPLATQYDIVLLPAFPFDFRLHRPRQLAAHFARAGHRVYWMCPNVHLEPDSAAPYRLREREKNLWEVNLRGRRLDLQAQPSDPETAAIMLGSLEKLYAECGIAENCVIVQWPAWHPVAETLRDRFGARMLYDCAEAGQATVQEERRLIESSDVFTVASLALQTRFASLGKPSIVVRNAADFDFFQQSAQTEVLSGVPRPVVGYFGSIADWTDLDLVLEAARRRPQYTFVLLGRNSDQDLANLAALENVRILGPRPYQEMPAYLGELDVGLIPLRPSGITADPVKLYEYFSLGKPVVATATRELSRFGDLVYLAGGPEDFIQRIDEAVAERDPQLRQRRIDFARANTWAVRVASLDTEIRKTFPLVSILIVTHNSRAFVKPCFDSLLRNTLWPNCEVVAVDNASGDGTAELLQSYAAAHPRVRVWALKSNRGFAGGNNFAASQARGEHLILLNADTMVTPGWVERLIRPARSDHKVGVVVAVTNFADTEAKIDAEYRNQAEMEALAGQIARERAGRSIDLRVAPLFCTLIPRHVWQALGELDENFAVGMFEDDDYSLRAQRAGYRVVTAEDCFVHHFGRGSFSQLDPRESERIFETNRERFEKKWGEPWQPHRYRPDVRPAHRERRFSPAEFCAPPVKGAQ